jgi:DNA gyrase subunit A
MSNTAKEILSVTIENELKQSYLDYAMSVIVGRALPDVRDGLKPVHRRVLYAMSELGNDSDKPYKKSARIVGDVIGKYHPHGDTAVYDTMVRMAQPFSMRYMLIDGQGNFGSVDGDSPAAMRYTEVRLSKIAHSLLSDLDKNTVDFSPNYDETEFAPVVLPARIPNLLINGSSGIAVGMATNIPPHNLTEVINACIAVIEEPDISIEELMQHVPGPDFPTAGIIAGKAGIAEAYRTGRGRIYVRARTITEINEKNDKQSIIVTELPYQVNKARLIERIAELVKEKQLEGITALRDESDREGMRVVIELRRGENLDVVLNHLYTQTQMQVTFGFNVVALVDGQPRILNLKQILDAFLKHRREVVTRRTLFDLNKTREKAHLLEGLGIALANIDEMIELIKTSKTPAEAKERLLTKPWEPGLVKALLEQTSSKAALAKISNSLELVELYGLKADGYWLSPKQAQAILELRLHRLTALEQDKIIEEYKALLETIEALLSILNSPEKLMTVIREELEEIRRDFGDARRTEITMLDTDLTQEDFITPEDVVVTFSHQGYVKYQPLSSYSAQKRGGKGKSAADVKDEDIMTHLVVTNTHDTLLCFSNYGRLYWAKVYTLPEASRIARGRPIVNILPLAEGERITNLLPIKSYDSEKYVVMATANGVIKKVSLVYFSKPRTGGIKAVELDEGDHLIGAAITNGKQQIMLFSDAGKVIQFEESKVRAMGRLARGVRGMRLDPDQKVIELLVPEADKEILTATENGYGKRTSLDKYRLTGRGSRGVISIQVSERNGKVVRSVQVNDQNEVMLITDRGTLVRIRARDIASVGRNTQGVRLIRLTKQEKLVGLQPVDEVIEEEIVGSEEIESTDSDVTTELES